MGQPVASFHLTRERGIRIPAVLAHLGLDRRALARTAGLRFVRLMGTGRGRVTAPSADLSRTAMFAVWDDDADLTRFLESSPISRRWRAAPEHYVVRLDLLSGGGRWSGVEPLATLPTPASGVNPSTRPTPATVQPGRATDATRPVAVLTRADVRVAAWRAFLAAGRPVSRAVQRADGLLAVAGVGEAPLGRQATFSLWRDAAAVEAFAYRDAAHVEVVRRTRDEGWYGDELFARFAPTTVEGTWDGVDPLAIVRSEDLGPPPGTLTP